MEASVTAAYGSRLRLQVRAALIVREGDAVAGTRALIATVGHQLRTPLASIRGYIETLLDEDLDPATQRRFLQIARREALRLSRLIDALQGIALPGVAGESEGTCDLAEQVCATIDALAPLAAARNVLVSARLPSAARVLIDADACVHALANLLDNALKYGREGGTVAIACARQGAFVRLSVDDDGSGIAPGERERIFGLGVRGERSHGAGAGIGLAVVRAIARRAGGDVRVEPSALGGARFVLRLPAG